MCPLRRVFHSARRKPRANHEQSAGVQDPGFRGRSASRKSDHQPTGSKSDDSGDSVGRECGNTEQRDDRGVVRSDLREPSKQVGMGVQHPSIKAGRCLSAGRRIDTNPPLVVVQIDVATADDGDNVAAGEAVRVLQNGGDAKGR